MQRGLCSFSDKSYLCVVYKKIGIMDDKELNAYRLTSMDEPTDEMLSQIMKEVAEEARQKSEEAHRRYFATLDENIRAQRAEWNKKHNAQCNGRGE